MRISDWSSDVCSSDLSPPAPRERRGPPRQSPLTPILYNLVSHVLTCTGVGRNPFTRERLFAGSIASHRGDAAALRRAALSCGYFRDRKSVVSGKSVSVRDDLGGRRIIKKKKEVHKTQ